MIFHETGLDGAYLVELEPRTDERGFFARSWCQQEFAERSLNSSLAQCNISFNKERGTLRGLHFQRAPHEEAKLVRCTRGAVFDVIIDLRPNSPSFTKHYGIRLDWDNRLTLFVPKGFAHGFQTLCDSTEVFYQVSQSYVPAAGAGIRWDDPTFGIEWPSPNPLMNERDRSWPDWSSTAAD
jgi:dTDP-4-dehydrorhamnose 3,5-epimerase